MPAKLPQNVLEMRGKSHQTKAEKQARRESEPKVDAPRQVRAPVWLPEYLRDEYVRLGKKLCKVGLLTRLDFDVLARYIMSRDAWVAAHTKLRGALDASNGQDAALWTRLAKTYFEQCHQCATAMGLTISSRCKLVVPKPPAQEDDDPLSKMLLGRAERR